MTRFLTKSILTITTLLLASCSIKYTERLVDKGFGKECINEQKKAMKIYNRAVLLNKRCVTAYWRRGNLCANQNKYPAAISDLTKSIRIDSTFDGGNAFWDRAYCKVFINDTIGALADYNKAIAISPEKENFFYFRGVLKYCRFHDLSGALQDFDSAIKFWDRYDLARLSRAKLKIELNDFHGAMEDYNKLQYRLRDFDSSYAGVFYFRGIAKYETGDKNGACSDFTISDRLGYLQAKEKLSKLCSR